MNILIGADLVPTQSNFELFKNGDATALIGNELQQILNNADYRIFNLETPLTDVLSPIEKCGPALSAPVDTIAGYKSLGVDCLTVSNNHIMDQGEQGFASTINALKEKNIAYVGGAQNLKMACAPHIVELDKKKFGIYACAEHEFSIATDTTPGANPFDPLESLDHIVELKTKCDYVIVLYHGGKEHYRYPSPQLQKRCRKLIEKGADLVVCQHSHCIGCEEKYQNGTIVYGQGNFLFDYSKSEFWETSLLVKIENDFSISYIPLQKQDNCVRLAQEGVAEKIISSFYERSEEIKSEQFVASHYSEHANKMLKIYISGMGIVNSKNIIFRVLNKVTKNKLLVWMTRRKLNKKTRFGLQNYIECEAHRELLLEGLKVSNKKRRIH